MMIPNIYIYIYIYVYIYIYLQYNTLVNINQPGKNPLNGAAACEGKIEVVIVGTWTIACWGLPNAPALRNTGRGYQDAIGGTSGEVSTIPWCSSDLRIENPYFSMIQTDSESGSEYIYFWLVVYLPLWKIWKSMGRIIPYIMGKNVWNHQPDFDK